MGTSIAAVVAPLGITRVPAVAVKSTGLAAVPLDDWYRNVMA